MYKHILLAVDLEHDSTWQKSLPTAVEYAQAFGSTIHAMVVVPDFGMSIVGSFFPKDHKKQAQDLAIEKLHAWTSDNIPDSIPVQHIVGTVADGNSRGIDAQQLLQTVFQQKSTAIGVTRQI